MTATKKDFSDVPVRIRSWIVIIVLLTVALLTPSLTYLGVALLSLGCVREFMRVANVGSRAVTWATYALLGVQLFCSYTDRYLWFTGLSLVTALALALAMRKKSVFAGLALPIASLGTLAFIRNINLAENHTEGIGVLLFLIVLTELNDVFQYLCGKNLGRHKITPRISPNKTVEGFIGGVILTSLLATGVGHLLLPAVASVWYPLMGLMIAGLGFCGDILMSGIKRHFHVKDTGSLIPGHGGLLDRVDSLLLVTPIYYGLVILLLHVD